MKPTKRDERVGPSSPSERKVVVFSNFTPLHEYPRSLQIPSERNRKRGDPDISRGFYRNGKRKLWRRRMKPSLTVCVGTNMRHNADAPIRNPDRPPRLVRYISPVTGESYPMWVQ